MRRIIRAPADAEVRPHQFDDGLDARLHALRALG